MNARKKQSQDTNSTSLLKGRGTAEVWKRVTVCLRWRFILVHHEQLLKRALWVVEMVL